MSTSCAALLRLRLRAVDPILGGTHEHMAALVSIGLGRSDEVWKSHGLEPRMPGTLHGLPLSVRAEQGAQGGGPHRGTSRTRKPRRMGVKKSAIRHVGHAQGATPVGCGIGRPVLPNLSLVNVRISWLEGPVSALHALRQLPEGIGVGNVALFRWELCRPFRIHQCAMR